MRLSELLERIPRTVALLDAAVAALTVSLLPDRLVPENMDVIVPVATLLVVLGFIMTVAYARVLRRRLRALTICACVALLSLMVLQVLFVESVAPYGSDAGTHRFITGFQPTEAGAEWSATLGAASRSELIRGIGADRIPAMWGVSHYAVAIAYGTSYLLFILATVLALGGTELAGPVRQAAPATATAERSVPERA